MNPAAAPRSRRRRRPVRVPPRPRLPTDPQAGSGTVLALGVVGVVVVLLVASTCLVAAVVASHRARSAADLAAVSAATAGASCGEAARIASRHGATLVSCRPSGPMVDVEVTVPAGDRGLLGALGPAHATARAGPDTAGAVPPAGAAVP